MIGRTASTCGALFALGACAATPRPTSLLAPRTVEVLGEEVEIGRELVEGHEEEEFEPGAGAHGIGVFVGGSDEIGDKEGYVVGLDYGYRVTDEVGVGAFLEFVSGIDRSAATGFQSYWVSPIDVVLFAGAGFERKDSEWEPILRVGIEYEIVMTSGWILAPSIFYDWGEDSDVLLYGFTFGRFF